MRLTKYTLMKIKSSWDDGSVEDVKLAKLMSKYGIETTFFWPVMIHSDKFPTLSPKQRRTIARNFEIGSHTITHPLLTRIDIEQARDEIEQSREMLAGEFNQDILKFCYPRGYSNPEIQQIVVESGYESARSTLVGYIHESENPYFEQTTVHVGCNRKEYAGLSWLEYALKMLEQARKTPNSVYHFWGHGHELTKNNAWADLEILLKELK